MAGTQKNPLTRHFSIQLVAFAENTARFSGQDRAEMILSVWLFVAIHV